MVLSDWFIRTQKVMMGYAEAAWEATPQMTLQFYIILVYADQKIELVQYYSILSSALVLSIPSIETYLQGQEREVKLLKILGYYPLFFTANLFKILSTAIILVLFTFPGFAAIMLLSGALYMFISIMVGICRVGNCCSLYLNTGFEVAFHGIIRSCLLMQT